MKITLLQAQDATTQAQDTLASASDPSAAQNILDIIGLAGGFQWPILLVFVLGLAALMNTLVRLYHDGVQSKSLRNMDTDSMEARDFQSEAEKPGQSIYHNLLQRLLRRSQFTSDHGGLLKTVGAVISDQQESFSLTNKLVTYCSSAAGGLGLAGTLVGMYSSFAAAGTDPNTVYVGISLALVSTLLGVAASLILEAAETFVSRYAGKHLAKGRAWGENVATRMSYLGQQQVTRGAGEYTEAQTN